MTRAFGGGSAPEAGFPRPRSAPCPAHLDEPATSRTALADALAALRPRPVETVGDLLEHVPFRHEDFRSRRLLADIGPGEEATVVCTVERVRLRPTRRRNLAIVPGKPQAPKLPAHDCLQSRELQATPGYRT